MYDGTTPQGQMELRLEAFQDTDLIDLRVDADATVTATYPLSDTNHYVFTVSDYGSRGNPEFTWCEVTIGDFDIYTRSYEHRSPIRGLPELIALEGREDMRKAATALIGIHEVAAEDIQACIDEAVNAASYGASERLTRQFRQEASSPVYVVINYFLDFQAACQQRAPYCDEIVMDWGHDLGQLPRVVFGLGLGSPDEVRYEADPDRSKQLYLNGFWTAEHCLEDVLLEQFPNDAWARLGARNAARDLLAIQRAGFELMAAQRQDTLQDIDQDKRECLYHAIATGQPFDTASWSKGAAEWLEEDLTALFERVKEYLESIKPKPRPKARRGPKPGTPSALADAET